MPRYFLKRLGAAIPTLFIIVTLSFFITRWLPADRSTRSGRCRRKSWRTCRRAYGLDQPVWVQYGRYLRGVLARRFRSLVQVQGFHRERAHRPGPARHARARHAGVGARAGDRYSARHARGAAPALGDDYAAVSLAVLGIAVPSFVVLPLLGLVFGIALHWLPVAGWEPGSIRYLVLARHRSILIPARLYRAAHARRNARDARESLHPHGRREGPAALAPFSAATPCVRPSCRWRATWHRRSPTS
jgi:oligopeptide transport system permease protein